MSQEPDTDETPAARGGQHVRANRDQAFDAALGARIRALRTMAGMSQADLGRAIGVSWQQVQKYESGRDRVSASTLFAFAAALKVPPKSFYEGDEPGAAGRGAIGGVAARIAVLFHQIEDTRLQRQIVALAKALASDAGDGEA